MPVEKKKWSSSPQFKPSVTMRDIINANCCFEVDSPKFKWAPLIFDEMSLSSLLNIRLHKLTFAMTCPDKQYAHWKINKRNRIVEAADGSKEVVRAYRNISAPKTLLKSIQRRLCEEIYNKYPLPEYITGFRPGISCIETARRHKHGETILSYDIKDYFPSVTQRVLRWMHTHILGYSWPVANMLASLVTTKNVLEIPAKDKETREWKTYQRDVVSLPQGSPASPVLSNIISSLTFGPDIAEFCKERNLTFTLYVDDVTISTAKGQPALSREEAFEIGCAVTKIVNKHGFYIKFEKSKIMQASRNPQMVMGILVNDGLHVSKKTQYFRAILHNVCTNGWYPEAAKWMKFTIDRLRKSTENEEDLAYQLTKIGFVDNQGLPIHEPDLKALNTIKLRSFLSWLRGNINWINQVDPRKGEPLVLRLKAACAQLKDDGNEGSAVFGPSYAAYGGEPFDLDDTQGGLDSQSVLEVHDGVEEFKV